MPSPLVLSSAVDLARAVARGDCSATDVVAAHLDRIDRVNPGLNAFVEIRRADALAEATARDAARAAGAAAGALEGVPITVKSAIEVAGLRCETGSPVRAGMIAARDATVVARLRAAGAIVVGTTNVAEMLMAYESDNPLYGRTSNPYDLGRTAGGSSGGEAAAIAAGCSAAGIGSDGGGSIRVPAHFCGLCGLKPTPGRIPSTGHQPACLGPFALIGVVGPMARTVADLSLMFEVMAGADDGDPMAASYDDGSIGAPEDTRVAWFDSDGRTPVTGETAAAVRRAADATGAAGYLVDDGGRQLCDMLDRARRLWGVFFAKAGATLLNGVMHGAERRLAILEQYANGDEAALALSSSQLLDAWLERDALRADFLRAMARHPIILCPVTAVPAFRHGEREWSVGGQRVSYLDAMSYTVWFNLLGLPAAVVPIARSHDGLPIGVQIVGRPYEERRVLAVAAAIERAGGGFRAPEL